jgi:hypothetical protein
MMRPSTLLCLVPFAVPAQEPADWRMPFRRPIANVEVPADVWKELRVMRELAMEHNAPLRHEDGVEVSDDPTWQKAYERLKGLRLDGGYLSAILRESGSATDRAIAFYGAFFVPDPALVLQLIAHIPGEPVRSLREDAYRRAVAYLAAHLPKNVPGDLEAWRQQPVPPNGQKPPRPGDPAYTLDPEPFVALLAVDDYKDHVQALWFLRECVRIRPQLAEPYLALTRERLRELLASEEPGVAAAAVEFVQEADPQHRPKPPGDASDADRLAWLDAVLYDVFPPIRRVSSGLVELWPHADVDRLVELGRRGLGDGTLGEARNGKLKAGGPYRGFAIASLPEPLDRLGLAIGSVLTSINGVPVATGADLLRAVEAAVEHKRSFLVEYVRDGVLEAMEFRLR